MLHILGNPEETAKSTFLVDPGTFVNEAAEHDDEAAVYEDEEETTVLKDEVFNTAEEWNTSFFTARITMEVKVAFDPLVWKKCRAA